MQSSRKEGVEICVLTFPIQLTPGLSMLTLELKLCTRHEPETVRYVLIAPAYLMYALSNTVFRVSRKHLVEGRRS